MTAADHVTAGGSTSAGPVRILTVCTGNICRSPYAAVLLRHGLEEVRPGAFEVTSAGTQALVGRPIDEGSAIRLAALGLADAEFRARLATSRVLRDQALVLVMTSAHKERVLEESPLAFRRTFTILELAHALEDVVTRHDWQTLLADAGADDVVSRWTALPAIVAAHRRRMRLEDRDVVDPYQRGARAFDRMSQEVDPAVRGIVRWERQFPR
jgi:protein-tyrosine phosphatase